MRQKRFAPVLSLLLVFAMLLGWTGTAAAAADPGLTRGEMAAILVDAAGLARQQDAYAARDSVFSDVAEGSEYEGWINLAWETGLICGGGDGCFHPEEKLSQVEAAAMLLRFAGVPDAVLSIWPDDYAAAASSTGLTQGVSFQPEEAATEDIVGQMMHNAAAMADKPFIGISWNGGEQDNTRLHKIVALAGGVAVELPRIAGPGEANVVASQVDGLIVAGGEDIDPNLYEEEHSPLAGHTTLQRDFRDRSDYGLIQAALGQGLPMLCIDRGMQMLNVVCGGGLIQDLPAYLEKGGAPYVSHRDNAGGEAARHDIMGKEYSKWLEDIIGGSRLLHVASQHRQAVDPERVGAGLTVAAYGSEEVIEAVEYQANRFVLGIQFHPERDVLSEDALCDVGVCLRFFETLVDFSSASRS